MRDRALLARLLGGISREFLVGKPDTVDDDQIATEGRILPFASTDHTDQSTVGILFSSLYNVDEQTIVPAKLTGTWRIPSEDAREVRVTL